MPPITVLQDDIIKEMREDMRISRIINVLSILTMLLTLIGAIIGGYYLMKKCG